jgi:hypothetical protein
MTPSTSTQSARADQDTHANDTPDFSTAAIQTLSRWNFEIACLYGKRIQECCAFPFSLMLCTSFDDFTDAQQKFSEALLADYRMAAGKIANSIFAGEGKARDGGAGEAYAAALLKGQEDARNIIDQAHAHAKRIMEDAEAQTAKPRAAGDKTRAA